MYTVHKERYGYSIAKWGDKSDPDSIYTITQRGCSCPAARRGKCKHLKLVNEFKELEPGAWAFEFVGAKVQPINLGLFEI